MSDNDLTAFQASQLQWLRSQVDRAQDDSLRKDAPNNAQQKLFYAREELRAFTSNLRKAGKNICSKGEIIFPTPLVMCDKCHYI
jgi:hypothetical protein